MNEQAPKGPSANEQIAEQSLITQVPKVEPQAPAIAEAPEIITNPFNLSDDERAELADNNPRPKPEPYYGGYNGINIGQMERSAQAYEASGQQEAADALRKKIGEISAGQAVEK